MEPTLALSDLFLVLFFVSSSSSESSSSSQSSSIELSLSGDSAVSVGVAVSSEDVAVVAMLGCWASVVEDLGAAVVVEVVVG